MRTVRYPIFEPDSDFSSTLFAEELIKSPYGSPELWDALSNAVSLAEKQIKKTDSEINEINAYINVERERMPKGYFAPEPHFEVQYSQIREIEAEKTAYMLMRENLIKGAQAAIKAVQKTIQDGYLADGALGPETRRRLLNELNPTDAEDLLKKLSDLTLFDPNEVWLYLARQSER